MSQKKITNAHPLIGIEEKKAVRAVLDSGILAQGEKVFELEENFAKFVGTNYAVATSNGTTALHLALLAAGIGEGDEVITTPFSFIASSTSILYTGARSVFVDVEYDSFNIDPKLIEKKITKKTKAILPVHLYGLPANMNEIMRIAKKHDLVVIEDACQAHGSAIGNSRVGSIGLAGCFSFYPTKNMTTGEGGMVTTNDAKLAAKVRLLREHGMKVRYHNDILGYNFRMTNIGGAIGVEQLKKLPRFNEQRNSHAKYLNKMLANIPGIITPITPNKYTHAYHQYTIKVTREFPLTRDELIEYLAKHNIGSGVYYPIPIHQQKVFHDLGYRETFPITEQLAQQSLSLPIHPALTKSDLQYIVKTIQKIIR